MATVVKTYTENLNGSANGSTWTWSASGNTLPEITANSDTVELSSPPAYVTAQYVPPNGISKDRGIAGIYFSVKRGSANLDDLLYELDNSSTNWTGGSRELDPTSVVTIDTDELFDSSNSTDRSVTIDFLAHQYQGRSWKASGSGRQYENFTNVAFPAEQVSSQIVTLDAPPSFDCTDPGGAYAPGGTYSVTVSDLEAQYGGSITSVVLNVGGITDSSSSGGALSVSLPASGTYTPTVTVTDSRGQETVKSLSAISIRNDYIYVSEVAALRTDSTGKSSDDGIYACVKAKFTYANATPSAPTVYADNTATSTTWYRTWSASSGYSNQVSDWSSVTSGTLLYGKITGQTFNKDNSYIIGVKPAATSSAGSITGSTITAFLAQQFFLIAGRAGGHALGIGQKPTKDDILQIGMGTEIFGSLKVNNNQGTLTSLIDLFYPVGSYYETSDGNFDPNVVWGGTWIEDSVGKVLVGYGTDYTVDGGAASRTVPLPQHKHESNSFSVSVSGTAAYGGLHKHTIYTEYVQDTKANTGNGYRTKPESSDTSTSTDISSMLDGGEHSHSVSATGTASGDTSNAGTNGASISVMQPYKVVNRWHRTA